MRQVADDAADRPEEAEVEHLVDFVEDEELDVAQIGDARVEMIDQPPGRRDQHVEAVGERADLRAMRHAAEDDGDLSDSPAERSRKLWAIWLASSRVGASTSTRAPRRGAGRVSAIRRLRIGSANAAVLPVPVWAMPTGRGPA